MGYIKQKTEGYTLVVGLYGNCESSCIDFDLTSNSEIFCVYEMKNDDLSLKSYNQSNIAFSSFTKLVCGKIYTIVLKPGEGSVTIPNFQSYAEDLTNKLGNFCEVLDNNTPTPTPTPINPSRFKTKWHLQQAVNLWAVDREASNDKYGDISNWDVSSITDMSYLFDGKLLSFDGFVVDLSNWDVSNVTDMSYMFTGQYTNMRLNLNNWDVSSVTNMEGMFWNALLLRDHTDDKTIARVSFDNWDTSNVTNMSKMFGVNIGSGSRPFVTDDFSFLDTSSVTNMSQMFSTRTFDEGFSNVDVFNSLNVSNVTNMSGMFEGVLASGWNDNPESSFNFDNWDVSSVTDMSFMFSNCEVGTINLGHWNSSSVTTMESMFNVGSSNTNHPPHTISFSSFDTSSVQNMSYMFGRAFNLTSLDVSNFNTSSVTNMANMFSYCTRLTSLDLSSFNTTNVTNMASMFYGCGRLATLNLGNNWYTDKVTTMEKMFYQCVSLTSVDASDWNVTNVGNMRYMFYKCSSITDSNIDFSNWCVSSHPRYWYVKAWNGDNVKVWSNDGFNEEAGFTKVPSWGAPCISKTPTPTHTPTKVITNITSPAVKGETKIEIPSEMQSAFKINQKIVIDKNTEKEEFNEIVDFGSLVLKSPLKYNHDLNAEIQTISDAEYPTPTPTHTPTPTRTTTPQSTPTPSLTPIFTNNCIPENFKQLRTDGTSNSYNFNLTLSSGKVVTLITYQKFHANGFFGFDADTGANYTEVPMPDKKYVYLPEQTTIIGAITKYFYNGSDKIYYYYDNKCYSGTIASDTNKIILSLIRDDDTPHPIPGITTPLPTEPYIQSGAFLSYSGDESDRESRVVIGGNDGATSLYCKVSAEIENIDNENKLVVRSNGVPNYTPKVGDTTIVGSWQDELSVSTDGNPNIIGEQDYVFKIPLTDVTINPVQSDDDDHNNVVNTGLGPIGISSNGVPLFNPWHNNQNDYLSASRDAMTFATFSSCCGHPSGAGPGRTGAGPYHYHKYPTCIAGNRGLSPTSDIIEEEDMADVIDEKLTKTGTSAHSPILGYMLDGYPVYGPVGTTSSLFNENTPCKILRSSYVLNGENYEYIKGSGDLDKCNAIYSATPEYPNGCYHYVLSIDSNEDGTVKRTENPLYIHRDTGTDEIKYIITPMYPYTTVYYRGNNFGSFTNGDSGTSIDPNDDPCAGYMVTWGPGIGPKPEDCHQEPPSVQKINHLSNLHNDDEVSPCTKDLKPCADGTYVGRDEHRNCEFYPCGFNMEKFLYGKKSWHYVNAEKYHFTFRWSCFCTEETTQPMTIYVENNQVVKVIQNIDQKEVSKDFGFGYRTLSELFDYVETKLDQLPERISIAYDEKYGYINNFFVDVSEMIADEEIGFMVNNLVIDSYYDKTPQPKLLHKEIIVNGETVYIDPLYSLEDKSQWEEFYGTTENHDCKVFCINGNYPLYKYQDCAVLASPSFSYHTHASLATDPKTGAEIWFYMPDNVESYHGNWPYYTKNTPTPIENIQCPQDVKECPNGKFVGRDPKNNCEFHPCENTFCPEDARQCSDGTVIGRLPELDCNFPACGFDKTKFIEAKNNWINSNITSYNFDFRWSCYCTDEKTRSVKIFVKDREIFKILDNQTGLEIPNEEGYYDIDKLYLYIEQQLKEYPYEMNIKYNENGVPTEFYVDYIKEAIDDEMGFVITNIQTENNEIDFTNFKEDQTLKQHSTFYTLHFVYYGVCNETAECQSIKISEVSDGKIAKIYKFTEKGTSSYNDGNDDMWQGFTHLECGTFYIIFLKPGTSELFLENIIKTTNDGASKAKIISCI